MDGLDIRHPAAEANALVGPEYRAVVLEPSPPAVVDGEWFADDPIAPAAEDASTDTERPVLLPAGMAPTGRSDWNSWLSDHPERRTWAQDRWLGGTRSLPAAPPTLAATRIALHRLAAYVIAPARHRSTGRFGLRWTLGGFGTPFFGNDRQIRVVSDRLIDQRGREVRTAPITSLRAAADFLDTDIDEQTAAEHDSPAVGAVDEELPIDARSVDFLGAWFGMAFAGLERVRADGRSIAASRPQIWPGHFDSAIEIGGEDHRGSYGASPGDGAIDEPYLYVGIWWPDRIGLDRGNPRWNAESFPGAVLRLSEFSAGDPVDVAADFWRSARDDL